MSGSLAGLLVLNVLFLAAGMGLLPILRIAVTWDELWMRIGLAYLVGVAATAILAAHLALVDAPVGLPEVAALALVSCVLGYRRLRTTPRVPRKRGRSALRPVAAVGAAGLLATFVLLVQAWRTFLVRPLLEWDGWAIWGMKARALYDLGGADNAVFTSAPYGPLQHPLLLPALEAMGFRSMGAFDGTLIHVQLLLLACGFVAALWPLLRDRVPLELFGLTVLALLASSPLLKQLSSNLADVPLAFFVALGVTAFARWLRADEHWLLACGALFLGAATLTKSEGLLFALAGYAALIAVLLMAARSRLRPALIAGLATFALYLPWRIFIAAHHLPNTEYRLSNLFRPGYLADHSDRAGPAAGRVLHELASGRWGYLLALIGIGLAAALLSRRFALAGFTVAWLGLSLLGLVLIYWISVLPIQFTLDWSAYRTVTAPLVGGVSISALLVGEALRDLRASRSRVGRLAQEEDHRRVDGQQQPQQRLGRREKQPQEPAGALHLAQDAHRLDR